MAAPIRPWKWPSRCCSASAIKLPPSTRFTFDSSPSKRHRSFTALALRSSNKPSDSSSKKRRSAGGKEAKNEVSSSVKSVSLTSSQRRDNIDKALRFDKALIGRESSWQKLLFTSNKVRSIVLLNVVTVVYASNIPVVKEVEALMDPAAFTVVRFAVSAIPFLPFVFQARNDVHTRNAGIELGFWVSLGYLMQALGLLTSDAGRASFISMLTVIVVPLLDGMLGAIVPARTWFGALTAVLGVAMLESSGSPPCMGDLLNFLSAVFFGVHMLRTEHISRSTNRKNVLPLLGYEVCVIAFFSVVWYFIGGWFGGSGAVDPLSWTWTMVRDWTVAFPWIPALYTGVFSTGLCLWIEMAAMRDVSATETALVYALEPVWGASFAWFLLGERWGTTGWIGAALVLGGSLTVQIFGSSSSVGSGKDDERSENVNHQPVSEKQHDLSAASIKVSSRKDVPKMLKK